jgi:hypothetical protein
MAFIEALLPAEPARDASGDDPSSSQRGRSARSRPRRSQPDRSSPRKTASAPRSNDKKQAESKASGGEEDEGSAQSDQPQETREPAAGYEVSDGEEDGLSVEEVRRHWTGFLDALRPKDLSLEALMRSCEPVGVEKDVIVLSFDHKFHRSKVEEDKKRHTVEDVLSDLFGQPLRVRCVMNRHSESRPAQKTNQQREDESSSSESDVSDDPLVRMAVDELGAEIVPDTS